MFNRPCLLQSWNHMWGVNLMTTFNPIDPNKRVEILDVLRGFALLGIIFNNILYFSGYSFIPFSDLKQFPGFQLNQLLYNFLDIVVTAKFYTLFSILFAVGFYLQFSKYRDSSIDFLRTYRRRLFILLCIGLAHSLIWFGDILFLYAILGFILILFRNVKSKNLLKWSLLFLFLPVFFDMAFLLFSQTNQIAGIVSQGSAAHSTYPDITAEVVINTFKDGTIIEIFFLNIHNLIWKWLSYIPSGRLMITLGIFLLGYYLSSIKFFEEKAKSTFLLVFSLIVGLLTTISAQVLGGNPYLFPPTISNTLYKALLTTGQIFICIFYITSIFKIIQSSMGKRILNYLKPFGRMALTNYIFQTIICTLIFYNFGFNLIGRIGLRYIVIIAVLVLLFQIVLSNFWLKYYRFGPLEWIWRSLTYKKKIEIRNEVLNK